MKIQIRYDFADLTDYERLSVPSTFAGKVFPVIYKDLCSYQIKRRLGVSSQYQTWFVLKKHCTIHHQRTRHGNKTNNSPTNNY